MSAKKQEDGKVLAFPGKKSAPSENPFDGLAKKLEARIDRIENELKDSLSLIEDDIHKLVEKGKVAATAGEMRDEIDVLSRRLEERLKSALNGIVENAKTSRRDREEIALIKALADKVSDVLSADIFKSFLGRTAQTIEGNEVDEFGMDPLVVEKIKPIFDFLYFKYWRVKTTGVENIPNDGRALVVANHSGTLPYDGTMLAAAIYNEHPVRRDARFLVENFVFHMPFLGSFFYRIGGVRACPENAELLLDRGHLVCVFPEGVKGIGKHFRDRYKLQRFGRGGFVKICIKTKSPLIPVGIIGAEEIHPIIHKSNILAKTIGVPYIPITFTFPWLGLLGAIPFPTKWSIHFGKPIRFDRFGKEALDDEIAIHKLSEMVRGEIQSIIVEQLKKRQTILWG